jgi:hypothetical protein
MTQALIEHHSTEARGNPYPSAKIGVNSDAGLLPDGGENVPHIRFLQMDREPPLMNRDGTLCFRHVPLGAMSQPGDQS